MHVLLTVFGLLADTAPDFQSFTDDDFPVPVSGPMALMSFVMFVVVVGGTVVFVFRKGRSENKRPKE
jgi:uncharacterized protein involved in response to NO